MIISKTPLRLSLVGGGTDIPTFYERAPGAVVSMAINRYVYVMVNEKFDGRFRVSYSTTENVDSFYEISHDLVRQTLYEFRVKQGLEIVSVADIPGEGTGLGSSSAFEVGLVNALNWYYEQDYLSPGVLAELAYKYESGPHPNIGKQDHYSAAYGGFNLLRFHRNHVVVIPMEPPDISWFLLLYTGITRKANELLGEQKKALEGDKFRVAKGMAYLAEEFYRQSQLGHVDIGSLMRENWILKSSLYEGVSNDQINFWYMQGTTNGALGGKLCGAGGGGFLLFYAPPDAHDRIVKATGLRKVDFRVEWEGSKVFEV